MIGWLRLAQAKLQGKKTYLLAGVLVAATLVLVFIGRLTPETAFAAMLIALGGFAATFRAALGRHQREALGVLSDIAAVGVAARAHNRPAEQAAVVSSVEDAVKLAREVDAEGGH